MAQTNKIRLQREDFVSAGLYAMCEEARAQHEGMEAQLQAIDNKFGEIARDQLKHDKTSFRQPVSKLDFTDCYYSTESGNLQGSYGRHRDSVSARINIALKGSRRMRATRLWKKRQALSEQRRNLADVFSKTKHSDWRRDRIRSLIRQNPALCDAITDMVYRHLEINLRRRDLGIAPPRIDDADDEDECDEFDD